MFGSKSNMIQSIMFSLSTQFFILFKFGVASDRFRPIAIQQNALLSNTFLVGAFFEPPPPP